MRRIAWCLVAFAGLSAGCGDKASYIKLKLESAAPVQVTAIDVTSKNAGDSATTHIDKTFTVPPEQSFSLQYGSERRGDVMMEVKVWAGASLVADVTRTVTLVPQGTADAVISFDNEVGDMSAQPDARLDLASIPDLSAAPDLALAFKLATPLHSVAGINPTGIVAGDLDRDGKLDLAVSNAPGTVSVLIGKGDGTFVTPSSYPVEAQAIALALGDLNSDMKLDIVSANRSAGTVSVLLGNGDGTFPLAASYAAGNMPQSLAIALVDGDRNPDVVVIGPYHISFLQGTMTGSLQPMNATSVTEGLGGSVALVDLDGDRILDAVAGYSGFRVGGAATALGNGDGTFKPPTLQNTQGLGPAAQVGDMNGDSKVDLVVGNADRTVAVLLGLGDGTFQAAQLFPPMNHPTAIALGDLNDDGRLDVVATDSGGATASVLLGNGDGTLRDGVLFATEIQPYGTVIGDFNRDGLNDLATADYGANGVSVFLNRSR